MNSGTKKTARKRLKAKYKARRQVLCTKIGIDLFSGWNPKDNKPEVEPRASGGQGAPGQRWKRYGRAPKGATIIADDAVAGRASSKRQTAVNALLAWRDSPPKKSILV